MSEKKNDQKRDPRDTWMRVGKWIIKVCIMAMVNAIIIVGYFIYFKPCDRIQFCAGTTTLGLEGVEQVAAYAIENAQQNVVLLEWFIVTLMSIFAGVVAYLSVAQINANKELQRMRIQSQEIIALKAEWANQISVINKILRMLPRRILSPEMVETAREMGLGPTREDQREAQEWLLWQKWNVLGDESGYQALSGIGPEKLCQNVKFVIFLEIEETKKQIDEGMEQISNVDLKKKLDQLRSLIKI